MSHVLSTPTRTSDDDVVGLIEAYRRTGDRRTVERLLAMHGKILNHLVRRYADSSGEAYEDLLQVGYVGLIKAIRGYDEGSGGKVQLLRLRDDRRRAQTSLPRHGAREEAQVGQEPVLEGLQDHHEAHRRARTAAARRGDSERGERHP